MDGMRDISPGRNIQFIPYGSLRSFRTLDDRPGGEPHFFGKSFERRRLDSKIVFKDWLVFDSTINPDFAQVESDEPQTRSTSDLKFSFRKSVLSFWKTRYFDTPINLVLRAASRIPNMVYA